MEVQVIVKTSWTFASSSRWPVSVESCVCCTCWPGCESNYLHYPHYPLTPVNTSNIIGPGRHEMSPPTCHWTPIHWHCSVFYSKIVIEHIFIVYHLFLHFSLPSSKFPIPAGRGWSWEPGSGSISAKSNPKCKILQLYIFSFSDTSHSNSREIRAT